MRIKGFTLIELLAVIVILAIIALIATPIILGIINDARKESNERSAELYASAVRNAIASYQLTNPNAPTKFSDLNVQYDGDVICSTQELYADGSFYIADCTVNGDAIDYTYGTQQITQVYKPQYYWFNQDAGKIGEDLPDDARTTVSELNLSYPFYLGFDVDANNKVTAAYACFIRNETEYCLKGADTEAFAINTDIIKDAYAEGIDEACSFVDNSSDCEINGLTAGAHSSGGVNAHDDIMDCYVDGDGTFECVEY